MTDKKLNVRVGLDVKGRQDVDEAGKSIDALGGSAQTAGKAGSEGARGMGQLDSATKAVGSQVAQAGTKVGELGKALRTAGVDTDELDARAGALAAELERTGGASGQLTDAQRKLAPVAKAAADAVHELDKAAAAGGGSLGGLGGSSDAARKKLGEMKLEIAAAGAAAYTIGRALGESAREAAGFEKAMAEVSTLVDDTSGMDAQSDAVRRLAREYGGDAQGQAKALYQIISAGAEQGSQAIGVLDQANKLAVGGVTDITTAADGLTSVMNAYGREAGTAAQVSDAFFVAMKAGKTTVGELSKSIGQVAPISAQAGVGLTELLSATAALTKGGTSTSESMTQVRAIMTGVIKPTKEAADLAEELGLKFDAQALKAKGLAGFLEDVRAKTGGNTETMAKLFGSVEALGGVLALTGNQSKDFAAILGQMDERAGATDEAFDKMAKTSGFAAKQFESALNDVRISAGQALTAFTPLLKVVTEAINLFNAMPDSVKTVVAGVGALGLAIGPAVLAVNSIVKAVGLATTAMGLQRAAALALPVPMAAAAAGATSLATAAGASVVPVTASAGAVGVLTRGVGLLAVASKALLGPWGLLLTALGVGASKFLDARQAAADADEANRKMLQGPAEVELPAKVQSAADATKDLARRTEEALQAQQKHTKAVQEAAKALGVDLVQAATGLSGKFTEQLGAFDKLAGGLDKLQAKGVDAVNVLRQAFGNLIDQAKTEQDFNALTERIQAAGLSAESTGALMKAMLETRLKAAKSADDYDLVGDRILAAGLKAEDTEKLIKAMFDTRLSAARSQQDFDAIRGSMDKLAAKYPELRRELLLWEEQVLKSSKKFISQADADLKAFGIQSKTQLAEIAEGYRAAWERISDRTDVSLSDQIKAFAVYRAAAVAANGGVESSQIALQRQMLETRAKAAGLGDEFEQQMGRAGKATDKARDKVKGLGDEAKSTIDKLVAAQRQLDAFGPGANGGLATLGTNSAQQARNAATGSTIRSDFGIDQKAGTIGSVYTPPPDNSGDYEWVTNDPARPGGYWRLSAAGAAKRSAADQAQNQAIARAYDLAGMAAPGGNAGLSTLGLPAEVRALLTKGADGRWALRSGAEPTATPSALGAAAQAGAADAASAPQAAPTVASGSIDALASQLTQLIVELRQQRAQPGAAATRHEVVLPQPGGGQSLIAVSSEAEVRALLAALALAGARAS